MAFGFFVFGLALLAVGVWAHMWRGKRKFDRTNAAGVEEFKSYGSAAKASLAEAAAGTVETVCLVAGLFCAAGGFFGMFQR